ncbi:MAG: transcription-repair coupling factor [Sedimentisphaerales bacterium]|nr:transcription-repair coupling factor [Sedimentisphaerales bacterium]
MELGRDKTVGQIISRLKSDKSKGGVVKVAGTWGSFAPLLISYISKRIKRPILYVRPHIEDADNAADDLHTFGAKEVEVFSAWETTEDLIDATDEIGAERLKLISGISHLPSPSGKGNFIIPTSIQALCQPVPSRDSLEKSSLQLRTNMVIPPEELLGWLVDRAFERVDGLDLPGQFAHRGGIVDIYAPVVSEKETGTNMAEAIRVEFFGDTIESIRQINLDTHRSSHQIESINIVSAQPSGSATDRELLLNILPEDTIVVLDRPGDIEEVANVFRQRSDTPERLYSWQDVYGAMKRLTQVHISRFAGSADSDVLHLGITSVQQFQHKAATLWTGHKESLEQLVEQAKQGKKVLLYCEAAAETKRVGEIIKESHNDLPAKFKLLKGFVHCGFAVPSLKTIVISHHELFGQFALRRRQKPIRPSLPVDTLADLHPGDYVVHASYGIGKFLGVKTITDNGQVNEYLTIEYADGVKIQASVANIGLVQKYIGTSPKRPGLSKVGSKKWQRQKEKVAKSVRDLAGELLEVQAKRQAMGGIAFESDSNWQKEFEESFAYQETPDQTTAAGQIKSDMAESVAMDRLLCGDVGYGKTELAMRAAFKAIENGRQVAMLVPTTVLCVQHGRTFTERFADFPITIEVLNRFRTPRQARDIVSRTKQGKVDILIGTHRLLSGDIGFKDLGLLIIDEEQRFGVEHKEKLKKLRINVDVLTMTATPIPRTLHMSLLGLRDISSLATPPLDRRSIVTSVGLYNEQLITKVIIRELNRQGQVFFLHNRVRSIEKKAWEIQKLVSDAKVSIAHGQMPKSKLERVMIDFVLGRVDVLVCTTIIESGLDIPNANTIFINDADRFGLAELHQLRGRVGRYKHRAYAHLLLPRSRSITPLAARRLKAIEEYSHLGAGFRIALRDLEIRGAGNILGPEQSGHIQLVGYQMYCELLADAVSRLKGQPREPLPGTVLDLGFGTYIPKNYISSERNRLEVYRKIAVARDFSTLDELVAELADVYGPVTEQVRDLLDLAKLKIAAGKAGIKGIVVSGGELVFSFEKGVDVNLKRLFHKVKGQVRTGEDGKVYLRLPENYFEPRTIMNVLRKMFGQ